MVEVELAKGPKDQQSGSLKVPQRSKIPGVLFETDVQLSPEVTRAWPKLREHLLNSSSMEIGIRFPILKLSDEAMGDLNSHFQKHPSEFGRQLMARLEEGNAAEIGRFLRKNHVIMYSDVSAGVVGLYKVHRIYQMDPASLRPVFGELTIPPEHLIVHGVDLSGLYLKGNSSSHAGFAFSGPGGKDVTAVVATGSKNLHSAIVNETAHLEQFNRYRYSSLHQLLSGWLHGSNELQQEIEIQSDGVSAIHTSKAIAERFVPLVVYAGNKYLDDPKLRETYRLATEITDKALGEYLGLGMTVSEAIERGEIGRRKLSNMELEKDPSFQSFLASRLIKAAKVMVAKHDIAYRKSGD